MTILRRALAVAGLVLLVLWLGGAIGSVTGLLSGIAHNLKLIAVTVMAAVGVLAVGCWHLDQQDFRGQARRHGWAYALDQFDVPGIGPAIPDPGNPGQSIRLYEVPAGLLHPDEPIGLLLAVNGTPNPATGRHETVAITVRAGHPDALSAAAAAAGVPRHIYAAITHRT